jgi:elongation factor P
MDMFSASDLRKGLRIEIEGVPFMVTEFNFVKPGKGQGLYNCKLKNMVNGSTMQRTFRDNIRIDEPRLDHKTLTYSYAEGDTLVFLDQNYNQVMIPSLALGTSRALLQEEMTVEILFHNGIPIDVALPTFVEMEIVHTEPGVRGDTATNVVKPATVAGGHEIQVPLFLNQGDVVRIDTRTGKYVDRVSKK